MELHCTAARETKLLSILRRELRLPYGLVKRLKPLEPFFVNGAVAHTDRKILPGDEITVRLEEPAPDFPAEDGPLAIVYEDDCLLVADKPAGMLVHPSFAQNTGTLANRLLGYYRRTGQPCAVHVVTRLDRDTVGLVVFAKYALIHAILAEALQAGQIEKVYYARTVGGPERDSGVIDLPIGRVPGRSLLRRVDPAGKRAVTEYRVLKRRGGQCVLELRPKTGRTHQLRVHCSAMGFPILGDEQYGGGTGGQKLCAGRLTFPHPMTGAPVSLQSNLIQWTIDN